jgi:hypothetical protein
MNQSFKNTCIALFILFTGVVVAQDKSTEHTYKLSKGVEPAAGTLEDVSWMVGSWHGTAFGSQFEEVWNSASAGSMVGMFKLFDEDKGVNFYELMLLKQEGDGLVLLVKHFSAAFSAWEEKDDFITFKLVKIDDNAVHFSGLSFYKNGKDKINGFIVMKHKDGSRTEHPINYSRVE